MNSLRVKCKGCEANGVETWLSIGERGVESLGGSYRFPVVTAAWKEKYPCPVCKEAHWYDQGDVRDAKGYPI